MIVREPWALFLVRSLNCQRERRESTVLLLPGSHNEPPQQMAASTPKSRAAIATAYLHRYNDPTIDPDQRSEQVDPPNKKAPAKGSL